MLNPNFPFLRKLFLLLLCSLNMQPHPYTSRKLLTLCLITLLAALVFQTSIMKFYNQIPHLFQHHISNFDNEIPYLYQHHVHDNPIHLYVFLTMLAFVYTAYVMSKSRPVYLVDHASYKAPDQLQVKVEEAMRIATLNGYFEESSIDFQRKIFERSGLGEETCLPKCFFDVPFTPTMALAREEAEQVMFGALDNLFKSTNVNPREIGILVVNCSLFNPTPSLSAMIINKYKLRGNIKSFNLGGMGCSAGIIAIDLAKDMLKVHSNTYALVVSTENMTLNSYRGNNKSMMLPNCLFRMGCGTVLMSNKRSDEGRAKYKLLHVVRTNMAANDDAYRCVFQEQDEVGIIGVSLSKNLMVMAAKALKTNIATLGPLVLPISEQLAFFATYVRKKYLGSKIKPYIPDFKRALDHFCIHAGGRAVIDELEKNLQLLPVHVEASRMTLYRFGNTSSSSVWYELAYTEAKGRVRKGDRVWQIAFGSGFKCNSAVWKALRNVKASPNNPWEHIIDKYPVEIKTVD